MITRYLFNPSRLLLLVLITVMMITAPTVVSGQQPDNRPSMIVLFDENQPLPARLLEELNSNHYQYLRQN